MTSKWTNTQQPQSFKMHGEKSTQLTFDQSTDATVTTNTAQDAVLNPQRDISMKTLQTIIKLQKRWKEYFEQYRYAILMDRYNPHGYRCCCRDDYCPGGCGVLRCGCIDVCRCRPWSR